MTSLWVAAGPQSNITKSSPTRTRWELPNRVGVGVGVPAPRVTISAAIQVLPDFGQDQVGMFHWDEVGTAG